jgi:hypothetical protein
MTYLSGLFGIWIGTDLGGSNGDHGGLELGLGLNRRFGVLVLHFRFYILNT